MKGNIWNFPYVAWQIGIGTLRNVIIESAVSNSYCTKFWKKIVNFEIDWTTFNTLTEGCHQKNKRKTLKSRDKSSLSDESWWTTDGWLMNDWLMTDERLMNDWWATDEWLMNDWWTTDERLMNDWWIIDEWLMND